MSLLFRNPWWLYFFATVGVAAALRALHNADEIFPAILEAIRGAEHTINLVAYIWRPGRVSDMISAALLERARQITLDEWRRRGARERVMERFWVLFAEQF